MDKGLENLALQGANPKKVPFDRLKEHVQSPKFEDDPLSNEYRKKIKNRATAIRAYCVGSCMFSVAAVKDCPSVICPLHPFRMGKDPFRGWEMPAVEEPAVLEDEDEGVDEFEGGEDGD